MCAFSRKSSAAWAAQASQPFSSCGETGVERCGAPVPKQNGGPRAPVPKEEVVTGVQGGRICRSEELPSRILCQTVSKDHYRPPSVHSRVRVFGTRPGTIMANDGMARLMTLFRIPNRWLFFHFHGVLQRGLRGHLQGCVPPTKTPGFNPPIS